MDVIIYINRDKGVQHQSPVFQLPLLIENCNYPDSLLLTRVTLKKSPTDPRNRREK